MSTYDLGASALDPDNPGDAQAGAYAGTGSGSGTQSDSSGATSGTQRGGDSGGGGGVKEQTQAAAGTARQEAQHVAEVAKGEAQSVVGEARTQASQLLDDARLQLEEQSSTQLDRLVGVLRELGDDLDRMVRGEPSHGGPARELVGEVADRARALRSQLEGRQPAELLDQVRGFARRRPGTFLLGSLVAGVVAGRLTRGAQQASSDDSDTHTGAPAGTASAGAPGSGSAGPLAGTASPVAGTGAPLDPLSPGATPPAGTPPPATGTGPTGGMP
ncbi:DivIVA domain-containing protein [Nocardioides daeguensis]|uniref:DUF3618 domain-containing protein n=1 Tax=Nocardioides daeguensis TaxID=908359 RepID=A0ABP6UY52_9ACTN|nr:DivIVA domain-containing protein [Nocardioides daeguensis]MBV6726002.1 DivIVA domain-containing protein [Nocardioides daeguensis]MCR1772482.1 DivIVA domain-containing protein [Nocardioides daeguensis]